MAVEDSKPMDIFEEWTRYQCWWQTSNFKVQNTDNSADQLTSAPVLLRKPRFCILQYLFHQTSDQNSNSQTRMDKTTSKPSSDSKQTNQITSNGEEEKDQLEEMLDRTGCKEIHFSLQVRPILSTLYCLQNVHPFISLFPRRSACMSTATGESAKAW